MNLSSTKTSCSEVNETIYMVLQWKGKLKVMAPISWLEFAQYCNWNFFIKKENFKNQQSLVLFCVVYKFYGFWINVIVVRIYRIKLGLIVSVWACKCVGFEMEICVLVGISVSRYWVIHVKSVGVDWVRS